MFKKLIIASALSAIIVPAANAAQTVDYGWEDGVGTILGSYGNLVDDENRTGGAPGAHTGSHYLHVAENPHSGTPQAFVGFVTGLQNGDVIDASFFGYDDTAGASPSLRISAHYAMSTDVTSYEGSAGGNSGYTDGGGWSQVSHSWTFDDAVADALVIEARLYSTPSTDASGYTSFFIDDLSITAPDHAAIQTASASVVPVPAAAFLFAPALLGLAGFARRT
jgi:hypothetical protein